MIRRIARWILNKVDVEFTLDDEKLYLTISLGDTTLVEWTIDLFKDDQEIKHGKKPKA